MQKHYNITVTGIVQGVFYRKHTQVTAEALGLKGFVMNRPDGSVYIEAEGEAEVLDQLVKWCRRGPERARVDNVEVSEGQVTGFMEFEVRR